MQINMNNINNQSFGSIKLCSGAEEALRKKLKPADWVQFDKIATSQASNSVDINLFGRNDVGAFEFFGGDSDMLMGRIITNNSNFKNKEYYQLPFFESTIKFIDKLAKKADNIAEKIKELPAVNVDEIIGRLK